jgi:hypothetical protein
VEAVKTRGERWSAVAARTVKDAADFFAELSESLLQIVDEQQSVVRYGVVLALHPQHALAK